MPTETTTKDTYVKEYRYQTSIDPPYATTVVSVNCLVGRSYDSRTYVLARRRPKGFVNPKPYTRIVYHGHFGGGVDSAPVAFLTGKSSNGRVIETRRGAGSGTMTGGLAAPSFDGGLATRAIIEARLKVKDQKVNFGVAFAEAGRTVSMVGQTTRRLASSIRDIRKGNFLDAAKKLSISLPQSLRRQKSKRKPSGTEAHNAWLEMQYGWKPLLSDVRGSAELLAQKHMEDPMRYATTVKSRKGKAELFKHKGAEGGGGGVGGIPCWYNQRLKVDQSCFIRLDYYLDTPWIANLSQAGLTNPLEIGWELVPFSFIVDWFVPVGNYLSLLDSSLGWTFRAGSRSDRVVMKTDKWLTHRNENLSAWSKVAVSGVARGNYKSLSRTVYTAPPSPGFLVKNPFSASHATTGLALLLQAFK